MGTSGPESNSKSCIKKDPSMNKRESCRESRMPDCHPLQKRKMETQIASLTKCPSTIEENLSVILCVKICIGWSNEPFYFIGGLMDIS